LLWPDLLLDLADWLLDQDDSVPVHIVGGAVRDAYLGYPLKDIDLVAASGAVRLARRLADAFNGDVFVMDAEREVARVLIETPDGKLSIDVAGYRAPDLLGDLTDRDFTINAMAVDLRGDTSRLIDPLGGEADLKAKLIRRCSPHAISQDPIRALRAVRQSVQLGARIEPETLRDLKANAADLRRVSPERVRDEFIKLLASAKPAAGLRAAHALGLVQAVLPQVAPQTSPAWAHTLSAIERLAQIHEAISPARTDTTAAAFGLGMFVMGMDRFRKRLQQHTDHLWPNDRPHRALLHLAVMLRHAPAATPQTVAQAAELLRLSNAERDRLVHLSAAHGAWVTDLDQALDVLAQHRFWHANGAAGIDAVLLALAEYLARQGTGLAQDAWIRVVERARTLLEAYYERHDSVVAPAPLVDGHQLMRALKLPSGTLIRDLLEMLREQQVLGNVRTRDEAIDAARAYVNRLN
jgi:tRNA nucleotidyltransferase/poly(A) polymerase